MNDIAWSCPSELDPYITAHGLELDEIDAYVHIASYRYGVEALNYAVDHILNGNKAKTKVNEQSIRGAVREQEESQKPLSQEEIVEATKLYFRQRKIDKMNFDLAKIQKQEGKV